MRRAPWKASAALLQGCVVAKGALSHCSEQQHSSSLPRECRHLLNRRFIFVEGSLALSLLVLRVVEICFRRLLVSFLGCRTPLRPDLLQADSSCLKVGAVGF